MVDSAWLLVIAPKFYRDNIGFMMAEPPNLYAAGLFYLIFIFGLVYFVINPGMAEKRIRDVAIKGGIFGLVTYATFDLTNQSVLKGWPWIVTIIDLVWGTFICTAVSTLSVFSLKKISGSNL
jgi:uncharacterized membrane protein